MSHRLGHRVPGPPFGMHGRMLEAELARITALSLLAILGIMLVLPAILRMA